VKIIRELSWTIFSVAVTAIAAYYAANLLYPLIGG
jgi:hypothetical protein